MTEKDFLATQVVHITQILFELAGGLGVNGIFGS